MNTPKKIVAAESLRLDVQVQIDARKDARERNRLGQFATPPSLALEITRQARALFRRSSGVRFLDPALGTGSFYSALRQTFPQSAIASATGVEIDPAFVRAATEIWHDNGLHIIPGDFTALTPPPDGERFNLVLTNPPYVRHHHLSQAMKMHLRKAVHRNLRQEVSGLAGLYCYFMLLCHRWMAEQGIAAWLIPTEFMEVNYGAALRTYLTTSVRLLRIHRFAASDVQFGDALVTSSVVFFEKRDPDIDAAAVAFSFGPSLENPAHTEEVTLSELRSSRKWTQFPRVVGNGGWSRCTVTLGDLFTIKRGLATGANSYFILPREEARKLGIPSAALRAILPSPRHLKRDTVEGDSDGYPKLDQPLALIDCRLPEEVIRRRFTRFWSYLDEGLSSGVHRGYLASRREPWYSQESRPPAPFLCTYMGRMGSRGNAFRFIRNESRATAANVYLLLYPKPPLAEVLRQRPALHAEVFRFLQNIDHRALVGEGRVYGGGLHKMEPRELARIAADDLCSSIDLGREPGQALLL